MALALVQQGANLNQIALDEFIEHRLEMKKPMTPLAIRKASNVLMKHPPAQQQLMVDTAIMSGWRGIYPVDPPKTQTSRQSTIEQDLTNTDWAN